MCLYNKCSEYIMNILELILIEFEKKVIINLTTKIVKKNHFIKKFRKYN